jgi:pumilio RNA-binding family
VPKERGGKGERRKRGGGGGAGSDFAEQPKGGKNKPFQMAEKFVGKGTELGDLCEMIADVVQDQQGSRLIQQKLEVASEEDKQRAFKAILPKMNQLTIHEFGNYVIQKFFEYGTSEQRRILAEQLVGQVLRLSQQMYGCRVVQKALDAVPIEQQVLLIGELKGNVLLLIEDQHGNHVIQKCIERLPTDKINFIVDSFDGHATRMAKNCYGCRVIQRLIEYCASQQISTLLDEVLRNCMELATDQYGNYVVQHVLEHSSRQGDREALLLLLRRSINSMSCHKYASNVVEKALQCGTPEERGAIISSIVGEPDDSHPPLLNMMRDRFGNYIIQRTIGLAQSPQREALLSRLSEQLPQLKKSNTYGKHIISALERAQAQGPPS